MEEDSGIAKRNTAWAPGTLDATRKAIGEIDPLEAREMQKKLGGEIMQERAEVIDEKSIPKKRGGYLHRGDKKNEKASSPAASQTQNVAGTIAPPLSSARAMPIIDAKFNAKIDKLMMSDSFGIKQNYGLFNFLRHLKKDGAEKIHPQFVTVTLKAFIDNIDMFQQSLKRLVDMAPETYKAKIAGEDDTKFRLLRMVASWNLYAVKNAYQTVVPLAESGKVVTADLMDLVALIAKCAATVYYYGAARIPPLIKEVFADEMGYPNAKRDLLTRTSKDAVTSWMYIESEVMYKLYPLLMRMCSDEYEEYVDFYAAKMKRILDFTGLKKYDLLLPEKPKPPEEKKSAPSKEASLVPESGMSAEDTKILNTGIILLDRMFPQAGFKELGEHPDLYGYFQPMYRFEDGFNILAPDNPLQVIVVLLCIIEDCLQGLRKVHLAPLENIEGKDKDENIASLFDEWTAYREDVFEKLYCDPLKSMVNSIYSQSEFENTQFCKKLKTSVLWQTVYHFLPHFKFAQLLLERPQDESKYRPLFLRTDYLRRYLSKVVSQCDEAAATHGIVPLVQNPWEHYNFAIQNEVSKRLDVLLGAKNTGPNTNANNANLLKYTLCIVAVLDWYINDAKSPAYEANPMHIFRISEEDGKPEFSAPLRSDQNRLFIDSVKARMKEKA